MSANNTIDRMEIVSQGYYEEMKSDIMGYSGDVAEAINYIKSTDDGLYRIGGVRPRYGVATCSSALYFGINDSCYYTDIDRYTYKFLSKVYPESFVVNNKGSKFSTGVGDVASLAMLCGYKYYLRAHEEEVSLYGYTRINTIGNIDVFLNQNYLSFGIGYDKWIDEKEIMELNEEETSKVMLNAVLLEDIDEKKAVTQITVSDIDMQEGLDSIYSRMHDNILTVENWTDGKIDGGITADSDIILSISIPFSKQWRVEVDGVRVDTFCANMGFLGIALTPGYHSISLTYWPSKLIIGIIVSILGLGAYGIVFILYARRRKNEIC